MPIHKVKAPDGTIVKVQAPEGATQEQIIKYAQENYKPKSQQEVTKQKVGEGMYLRPLGIDTNIEMPQGVSEFLSGAGRRLTEIGTLGTHQGDEATEKNLDSSGYATAGGISADLGTLVAGGGALKGLQGAKWAANLASKSNLAAKAGKGMNAAGNALFNPNTLRQAAAGSTGYGAATTNDRMAGGLTGLLGGGLGYGAVKGVQSLVAPAMRDGAQALLDRGVRLTAGEMRGGIPQRLENAATSLPFGGDKILAAKRQAMGDFGKSILNESLDHVGARLDDAIPMGREAIEKANRIIEDGYDDVLSKMTIRADRNLFSDLKDTMSQTTGLTDDQIRGFNKYIEDYVVKRLEPGEMSGDTFKRLVTDTRQRALKYRNAGGSEGVLGDAYRELLRTLNSAGKRQNPAEGAKLEALDKAYATISAANNASTKSGAYHGTFTPTQLLNEIKRQSSKRQFAKGKAFGQEYAENAKDILTQLPDSGTTTRAALLTLGGGVLEPRLLAAPALTYAAYANPVQGLIRSAWQNPSLGLLGRGVGSLAPVTEKLGRAYLVNKPVK